MEKRNYVTLEFPALPSNVELARITCACFASQLGDFTIEELDDIKLVVSEAVSNAIIHGYRGSEKGIIHVAAEISDSSVRLSVSDEGRGIPDIALARTPAYTTEPDRLGMGFTIMEALVDSLEVTSSPGKGTTLVFIKSPARSRKGRDACDGQA